MQSTNDLTLAFRGSRINAFVVGSYVSMTVSRIKWLYRRIVLRDTRISLNISMIKYGAFEIINSAG